MARQPGAARRRRRALHRVRHRAAPSPSLRPPLLEREHDPPGDRPRPGHPTPHPRSALPAGLPVLVVALARPSSVVKVPGLEGTVILAIDVSGSMLADDVKPNRMEAAKQAAKVFIERQRQAKNNVRVGIVSFRITRRSSWAPASTEPPLSSDRSAAAAEVDRDRPGHRGLARRDLRRYGQRSDRSRWRCISSTPGRTRRPTRPNRRRGIQRGEHLLLTALRTTRARPR